MPTTTAKLTIGSDPEFIFNSPFDNSFIPANRYIGGDGTSKVFGTDGHSETAELRPPQATDPLIHAANIKDIFTRYHNDGEYKTVYQLDFYSSCMEKSVGGHIHFGHPRLRDSDSITDGHELVTNRSTIKSLVTALDCLLAVPLTYLEVPEHAKHRKNGSYGHLGDFRSQRWGIEYRTPASWLATEELSKAVLTLAYSIAHQVIYKDFKIRNPFTMTPGFQESFEQHNVQLLKPYLPKVKYYIRHELELYPKYKEQIDYLLINAMRNQPILGTEIKEGWHLPFVIVKQYALMTIRELIEKMTESLPVPKRYDRNDTMNLVQYTHINQPDFQIPEISQNINVCMSNILPKNILEQQSNRGVYVYGKKLEAGEVVNIDIIPGLLTPEKTKRLGKLVKAVIKTFGYAPPTKVNIGLLYKKIRANARPELININPQDYINVTSNATVTQNVLNTLIAGKNPLQFAAKVGIGRKIREQNNYLAEAIVLTVLLFVNDTLYLSYKINRGNGRKVYLPIMPQLLVNSIKKNLIGQTKPVLQDREYISPSSENGQ